RPCAPRRARIRSSAGRTPRAAPWAGPISSACSCRPPAQSKQCSFKSLCRQPAFSIKRCHTSGAGGGNRPAVVVISDVAGRENSFDTGVSALRRRPLDVFLVSQLELATEKIRIGSVADRGKIAGGSQVFAARRVIGPADAHARDAVLLVPQHFIDGAVPF